MKNDENHRFSLILIILTYPLRFCLRAFFRNLIKNHKNHKNEIFYENIDFSCFWVILSIFEENGKFDEIRNKQLNLRMILGDSEHLFRNPKNDLKS